MLRRAREALRRPGGRKESAPCSNFEGNRLLWDRYAERWTAGAVRPENGAGDVRFLGDEWGTPDEVAEVVATEILPFVSRSSRVAEIGIGGGRIASRVAPHVAELVGFDVSPRMLDLASAALGEHGNVRYVLLASPRLPRRFRDAFDFVYAFDVFVHMDLHTMWKYFQEIRRVLRPEGRAFVHTANLATPEGWRRFAAQDGYSIEGHYFVSPETVTILARRAGLEALPGNHSGAPGSYRERDGFFRLAPVGKPL